MTQDCFPSLGLTADDVVATWAGLRPLIAEAGKAPRDTSRHDEVWRSPEGLLSIVGGKLTTYRRMGERVMEHVGRELGRELGDGSGPPRSRCRAPSWAAADFEAFREATAAALVARGVSPEAAERITWLYGAGAEELLRLGDADPAWLEPLAPGSAAVRGEVKLAVEQGMALTLADILDRRTALLLFSDDHGLAAAPAAAAIAGELLGWSDAEQDGQVDAYRRLAAEHGVPVADARAGGLGDGVRVRPRPELPLLYSKEVRTPFRGAMMMAVAKITAKGQTTIPHDVRAAQHVVPGDLIAWEVREDGTATVRRVLPIDLEYLRALQGTMDEWSGPPTTRPTVSFDRFAVVRVPFPFTDPTATRNRPALILSDRSFNAPAGHAVMAMITSEENPPWPLDCAIDDLAAAGLPAPSKVRFKLFTLDHRLVRGQLGALAPADAERVAGGLDRLLEGRRDAPGG